MKPESSSQTPIPSLDVRLERGRAARTEALRAFLREQRLLPRLGATGRVLLRLLAGTAGRSVPRTGSGASHPPV